MLTFVRLLRPLLPRRTKLRLIAVAAAAVGLAVLESTGVLMILPLIQLIATAQTHTLPAAAHWWSELLGIATPLRLAACLGALVFAAFLIKGIAAVVYLRWNLGLVLSSEAEMAGGLLRAYLRAPFRFHLETNSSEMQRTVHESVRRVYSDALMALLGGTADAVMLAAIAGVLLCVEPLVALVGGIYFALVGIGYHWLIHKRTHAAAAHIHDESQHAYKIVQQSIEAAREVQVSHTQDFFVDELRRSKQATAKTWRTILLLMQVPRYYLEGALVVGFGVLSLVLFNLRSTAEATAVLGVFLAAGFRMLPSLNRVLVTLSSVRAAVPAIEQISDDMARLAREPSRGPIALPRPARIELDQVSFRYQDIGPDVVRRVSTTIEPGQWVGVAGSSGSGKSTLLDLILGVLDVGDGEIRVGGVPMAVARDAWQQTIGYVPQSVTILDDTLRANIAFGVSTDDIDEAHLRQAVERAQLADVVDALPDGLATRIGEHGSRLSGGQRQRVGLARALYRQPAVLILDEATSALDTETESRIAASIQAIKGTMTIVSVAHRLSTIRDCDEIILLDEGALVGRGEFTNLTATNARFAELVRLSSVPV